MFQLNIFINKNNLMRIIVSESQYKKIIKSVQEQSSALSNVLSLLLPDDEDEDEPEDSDEEINDDSDSVPKDKLTSPLKNFNITGGFGIVRPGLDITRPHSGIDLEAQTGTELYSPGYGKVKLSDMGYNGGCGGSIWIEHENGLESRFCHCSKINVKQGDKVKRGQLIGLTGGGSSDPGKGLSTGAHLHYTLVKNGNLVNPTEYVDKKFYGESSESKDDDTDSSTGKITADKLDIKNKFNVDLENGPKHHGSRAFGNWESDNAWDMFAPSGTKVYSFTKGFVRYIKEYGQNSGKVYGTGVIISGIDGYPDIFYTHLKNVKLSQNQKVNVGTYIGEISEWEGHDPSGEHVHVGLPYGKHIRDYIA